MLHECKSLKPYQNQQVFEKMMVKNQGVTTIYLTKVQMLYEITNHIDVRYLSICGVIVESDVKVCKISTRNNYVNILTRHVPKAMDEL
jgi:ABC-type antimicrobial peptide transport system ATPase subunit